MNYIKLINSKTLFETSEYINLGEPGFIEFWDFSKANSSHKARVQAVSTVASVCYGVNSLDPKFKLYDKLARESIGLPSSSFEFVPVLLTDDKFKDLFQIWNDKKIGDIPNTLRYGYMLKDDEYLLTNLRALMYDLNALENAGAKLNYKIDDNYFMNNEEESEIIKENFFVFKIKATIRDFRQHNRHRRAMYQELSRRYTTGSKVPIEYRISAKAEEEVPGTVAHLEQSTELYEKLLKAGLKSEIARDVIPVSMYSTIWTAYYPDGLKNYLELRTKSSAQKEIRMIAEAMKEMKKMKG